MGFGQAATAQEQDTGVVLHDSTDFTIVFQSKKSELVFGITRKGMECKPEIIIRLLCKSVVQLLLEYYMGCSIVQLKLDVVQS